MFDLIAIITNLGLIIYLLVNALTKGIGTFSTNYVFIGYLIFTILTLPNLLSSVIFKAKMIGLSSALCFIYYPIQFLIAWGIGKAFGVAFGEVLPFATVFTLILWNILFLIFIFKNQKREDMSEGVIKDLIMGIIPAILIVLFTFILIRQPNSVVALDYFQHLTIPNGMFFNNMLCITPNQCSGLFLQTGYTTFYHIILGNITTFLQIDPIRAFYVLDIISPIIASIPIYAIFKKFTSSTIWSQVGVAVTLLIFVTGAYEFVFFIPQTFAILLFLMIVKEQKLSWWKLALAAILLFSTHFIIGAFLAVLLIGKRIIIENIHTKKGVLSYTLILLVSCVFFGFVNIAGFSIEKFVQTDTLAMIGSFTNSYFPDNLQVIWNVLGSLSLIAVLAIIAGIFKRKFNQAFLIPFSFLMIGLICYFIAPTYANKFLLLSGLYATILTIEFLQSLQFKLLMKALVASVLIIICGIGYFVQYKNYLKFYTQENGTVSAFVENDRAIIDYLKRNPPVPNTVIISDPYTQLMIESLANVPTVQAQYMQLKTRQNLLNYLNKPNSDTYESLLLSPGVPKGTTNIEFIYSGRISSSLVNEDKGWLYNMYSLPLNNANIDISTASSLIEDQKRLEKDVYKISDNFLLFR